MNENLAYLLLLLFTLAAFAVGLFLFLRQSKDDEEDAVVGHVGISPEPIEEIKEQRKQADAAKRAAAKLRHGRDFHTDEIKKRETELSRDLVEFNEVSARASGSAQLDRISKVRTMHVGRLK